MNKLFKFISVSTLLSVLAPVAWTSSNAAELSMPGFNGNINTTFTSGFSMRTTNLDCRLLEGYSYTAGGQFSTLAGEGTVAAGALAGLSSAQAVAATLAARGKSGAELAFLQTSIGGTGEGCAQPTSDTYGNTTDDLFSYGSDMTNDGNLNFRSGDIFDATQSLYSEISGTTDGGASINLSFVASVNPALDINSPKFKVLQPSAKDAFEQGFDVLDAYVVDSFDVGNTFVDITAGRFVTSWGESTFIPVGLNGLVTNALDLPKLQSPSASIKEALMPTEQLSITTGLGDGSTLEAYYQFSAEQIGLGVSGSYFGSEVFGKGANSLDASGTYDYEIEQPTMCPWTLVGSATPNGMGASVGAGLSCNATNVLAQTRHATNWTNHDTTQLVVNGLQALTSTELVYATLTGLTHAFTSGQTAAINTRSAGNVQLSGAHNGVSLDTTRLTTLATGYQNLPDSVFHRGATIDIAPAASGMLQAASDDGQYGLRWSKYIDNVGTGLDLGVYYANYHSKVPYIQMKMPNGVFAGDILGGLLLASADYSGADLSALGFTGTNSAGVYDLNGTESLHKAISNAMFTEALCDAVLGGTLRTAFGYDGTNTRGFIDTLLQQANYGHGITAGGGRMEYAHDSSLCATAANGGDPSTASTATTALLGTGGRLFAAVIPLNAMSYQGIFPEDNQVLGVSFNTNVNGTTVQGEIAYRPDFPLATGAGDQINQIGDKTGANDALNMVAVGGLDSVSTANLTSHITVVEALTSGDYFDLISAFERSTLGNVVDASGNQISDLSSYNQAYYYSKPYIEYDTWSGTLGTTTAFTTTHPITAALGADSSALVSEIGFVYVPDMDDNSNGYIARNGFNEGAGNGTTKCLGAFGGISAASFTAAGAGALAPSYTTLATSGASLTNIGSGVVDALFGNGGYCEDNPGADDFAATYRLLGTATYQNFNNSRWTLSPTIIVSHDFMGFAPSSLGGFVEDRMSVYIGASMGRGDMNITASYVEYYDLGNDYQQQMADRDYVSLSVSQSF